MVVRLWVLSSGKVPLGLTVLWMLNVCSWLKCYSLEMLSVYVIM